MLTTGQGEWATVAFSDTVIAKTGDAAEAAGNAQYRVLAWSPALAYQPDPRKLRQEPFVNPLCVCGRSVEGCLPAHAFSS